MWFAKWRPFCLNLDVFIQEFHHILSLINGVPVDTRRINNAIITSKRRHIAILS